jgi:hypothetical protein
VPVKNRPFDGTNKVEGDKTIPKNENRRGIDSSFLKKNSVCLLFQVQISQIHLSLMNLHPSFILMCTADINLLVK